MTKERELSKLVVLVLMVASLISCGGSSTSTGVLNEKNASSVAGFIITTIGLIVEPTYIGQTSGVKNSAEVSKGFLNGFLDKALITIQKSQKEMRVSGSTETTVICTGGGTRNEVASWSGSDSNLENYTAEITYTNCVEGPERWNGTAKISYQGSYVMPTNITIELRGMSYEDRLFNTSPTSVRLTTVYSEIIYNMNKEITSASATITGDIQGTFNVMGIKGLYNGFKMAYSFSSGNMIINLSGKITPNCINAEVTVFTPTNAVMQINSRCPVDGRFNITDGVGNVNMDFNSQGAMAVLFNNQTVKSYDSCSQAEGMCM